MKRQQIIIRQTLAVLRCLPWIRVAALTGSVATGEASEQDDIDWLIITAPRRLWLTRLLLFLLFLIFGPFFGLRLRRAGERQVANRLCFNLWLEEDALLVPKIKQTPFAATQIQAARVLLNRQRTWERFLAINSEWLGERRRGEEMPFVKLRSCFLLDFLNQFCFWLQLTHLKPRQTQEIVTPKQAFFHPKRR